MSQAIRATVGIVVISASVIAVSYMTSKGRDNERRYLQNNEISSLRQEIKEKNERIQILEAQDVQVKIDKKKVEESLKKATDFINDKANFDLPAIYKNCLDTNTSTKPTTLSDQDYQRYTTTLTNRTPAVKSYLTESKPGHIRRYIQIVNKDNQTVDFTVNEAVVSSIYPECKVTTSPFANYRLDLSKNTSSTL